MIITDTTHIGNLNPFRYRGYYYDTETKLYFLKTRYYDPEIGRFMTIDGIEYLNPETINGLNLYAYCLNNPSRYIDYNGCIPFVSSFAKYYYKDLIWGFDNKFWGRINYSITVLDQDEDKGFFYAFSGLNVHNGELSVGAGINIFEWFGLEVGANESLDVYIAGNITPWFNWGISVGLSGLSLSGSINIDKTNHEFTVGVGLAPVVAVVGVLSVVLSGGQTVSTIAEWFRKIFSF